MHPFNHPQSHPLPLWPYWTREGRGTDPLYCKHTDTVLAIPPCCSDVSLPRVLALLMAGTAWIRDE